MINVETNMNKFNINYFISNMDRVPLVDVGRGCAVVLMIGYHFCFDLYLQGIVTFSFNDSPFWLGLRTMIVSLFLWMMGISLHLAHQKGFHWFHYLRRLLRIAICAGCVTIVSIQIFPHSYIYFGVLHFMTVASLLVLPLLRLVRIIYWILGLGLIILGMTVHLPLFNHPALHWVGMMTYKPQTEDYVPIIPWFGVVLLGLWFGRRFHSVLVFPRTLPRLFIPLMLLGRIAY